MAQIQRKKISKKEERSARRIGDNFGGRGAIEPIKRKEPQTPQKRVVELPEIVSVKDFADKTGLPVAQVITTLMKNGVLATINQTIDYETASIIGDELSIEVIPEKAVSKTSREDISHSADQDTQKLVSRPPVVTVMGHVDHGKTTLLDNIRKSKVAESESGGITQHISAYQVVLDKTKNKDLQNRTITFLDTPGHAAFSTMREHGTTITDIVVLIVAANDGVMPQTTEVIEKSKANHVPIIVAINKVDLPDADIMRTKQQLSEHGLVPEEWGGSTVMVEISAKQGRGIDDLLEMILLQADLMDLKADPDSGAVGVIIESHMEKGHGALALALIENGTVKIGDPVAIGSSYGRVRVLENYTGRPIKEAGPSFPVRIAGLKSLPGFGDRLISFTSEKEAKDAALRSERMQSTLRIATAKKVQHDFAESGKTIELNIIIKSDVVGSLEAIKKLLSEVHSQEASIKIISEGVGPVSESDATLAQATGSKVLAFRVPTLMAAKKIAEKEGIKIQRFDVIYELVDSAKADLSALLPPEIIEEEVGNIKILAIFRDDKKAFVAGGLVESGKVAVGDEIKVFQNNNEEYRDKVHSLRHGKSETKECVSGTECGLGLNPGANVAVGDRATIFRTVKKLRKIE